LVRRNKYNGTILFPRESLKGFSKFWNFFGKSVSQTRKNFDSKGGQKMKLLKAFSKMIGMLVLALVLSRVAFAGKFSLDGK
jgi:hypothetical protein